MAQKRMLDKKISVSEQVADISLEAQICFTWSLPHADDVGLLPHSLRTLKALIVPMQDWTLEEFTSYWNEITDKQLIIAFEYQGTLFWKVAKFFKFQTLRKDIQPWTRLQVKLSEKARDSWTMLFEIMGVDENTMDTERDEDVTPLERYGNEPSTKDKRSKEKIREDKRSKEKIYTLDFEEFWKNYPKKVGKSNTFEKWKQLTENEKKKILEDVPKRLEDQKWTAGYIKDPERYIKNRQWEDEIKVVKKSIPTKV